MHIINKLLNNKQFKQALDEAEKEIYLAALKHAGNNQVQTAKLLGVARGTLIKRLKRWADALLLNS
jgi:DNA-binding protein Fis